MPNKQRNRGQHPSDKKLFTEKTIPKLQAAVHDLSWLLGKGYAEKSALKLVGDRYQLKERQRKAVRSSACSEQDLKVRKTHQVTPFFLENQVVHIDGFNLIIAMESALSNGMLFKGVDGCLRDLASIHGSYKKVLATQEAILLVGKALANLEVSKVCWLLDTPVSNSGRLKVLLYEIATANNWNWEVELVFNPDNELLTKEGVIITTDSYILNNAKHWFNLNEYILQTAIPNACVIDLTS